MKHQTTCWMPRAAVAAGVSTHNDRLHTIMRIKKQFSALLLAVGAVIAAPASAAVATNLVANGSFAATAAKPRPGHLPAATQWGGSGQKNVGADASGGLWLGVTTPVFSGNLSRTGWDTVPNASQTVKIPAACGSAALTYKVEFVGAAPVAGSGFRIKVGKVSHTVPWSETPVSTSVTLGALSAGSTLVDLAYSTGAKQINGVRAGILVKELALTCQ